LNQQNSNINDHKHLQSQKEKIENLERDIYSLKELNNSQAQEIFDDKSQVENLEKQVSNLQVETTKQNSLQIQKEPYEKYILQLEANNLELSRINRKLTTELNSSRKTIIQLSSQISTLKKKI
jgi:polyhydroxyalkanoate synthesis regulator phasin